jgi:hypothetical protein
MLGSFIERFGGARFRLRAVAVAGLLVLVATVSLLGWLKAKQGPPAVAPGRDPVVRSLQRFSPELMEDPSTEGQDLANWAEFWHHRYSYPTGKFDPAWLLRAADQDQVVGRKVPAGKVTYTRRDNASPLTLDPERWTSLGPQPESMGIYGEVSGRINDILMDRYNPGVAYLAVAGGGVWKSTNCCTTSTTWRAVLEDPLVATTAISDLAIDPNDWNVIYAASGDNIYGYRFAGVGVYRSTDAGESWTRLPNSPVSQYRAASKIMVDPRNSNTLILGTHDGLFFSYDAGQSWTPPCLTNPHTGQGQDITGLEQNHNSAGTTLYVAVGTVFAGTALSNTLNGANGIYRGSVPASGCPTDWVLTSRPDNGWPAGTGSGVPGSQGGNPVGRIDIALAPTNPEYVYAQVHDPVTHRQLGLWRSTNGGNSWQQRSDANALRDCVGQPEAFGQNWFNQGLVVHPEDRDTIFMNTIDVWRSTDGGTSFTDISCSYSGGNVHPDQHALAFVPGSTRVLLVGNDGGVYMTEDANAPNPLFTTLNGTLNTIEFYGGDITGNFAYSAEPGAMGGAQDNGTSANVWKGTATPGPELWTLTLGGDGIYSRIKPVQGQRWYQEYQYGRLRVSQFGPYGFPEFAEGGWFTANERLSALFPYQIYKNDCPPTGCTHLIAGSHRVYETIQGAIPASSWYYNSLDLTKNLGRNSFINSVEYSVSLSTTAIVGTNDGNVQYGFNLGQGTAYSASWVNVTGGNAVLPNRAIIDVATDPVNPLTGYAAVGGFDVNTPSTPGHLFRVTCTAECASFTWENKSGNLPDLPANSVVANPRYPQQVFVGTNWGLYFTDDINAASPIWYRFNAGLPNAVISDMMVDMGFTTLSVWTRSRGAYVWPLPSGPIGGTPTSTPIGGATRTPTRVVTATSSATRTATHTATAPATATQTPCVITFTDVLPTDYFYEPVRYLYCNGVISGYSDNTFRPYNNTTRGQLTKIVVLGFGFSIYTPVTPTFTDVPADHPFYAFVETAAQRGIVSGYSDGTFRPFNNVTRGQLSKIVVGAAEWQLYVPATPTFTDVPADHPFYAFVETAYAHEIISGYADSTFRPQNDATRGQISKIVFLAVTQR